MKTLRVLLLASFAFAPLFLISAWGQARQAGGIPASALPLYTPAAALEREALRAVDTQVGELSTQITRQNALYESYSDAAWALEQERTRAHRAARDARDQQRADEQNDAFRDRIEERAQSRRDAAIQGERDRQAAEVARRNAAAQALALAQAQAQAQAQAYRDAAAGSYSTYPSSSAPSQSGSKSSPTTAHPSSGCDDTGNTGGHRAC